MSKKKKEQVVTQEVVAPKKQKPVDSWEIKDRRYIVTGDKQPLTLTIPSKHTRKHALLWYDPDLKKQRELRYATNQPSPFVDEQKGESTMGHIIFREGALIVKKENQALQKLLSLYHPLKNKVYKEFDNVEIATNELDILELKIEALTAAKSMDIDHAEAILRVEVGSKVSKMSSKEIKRDLLLFANNNPGLFIELANDENVQLRNFAIRAAEANIITLSNDQRYFKWSSNDRKLMEVPFDQNPYSSFAAWLKTDEGVEVFKSIEKKLS
jgi:hypothetical protein